MYSLHMLQDVVCHLASSRQRGVYAKQFPAVTVCLPLFARSPGHSVDVHGGFLAEEGCPVVDVHVGAVAAPVSKNDLAQAHL